MTQENISPDILFQKEDKIATVTLNRPQRLNAYSPEMRLGIVQAIEDTANDDDIRVLIITGAGDRGFCTGNDWSLQASQNPADVGVGNKYRLDPVGWIARWVHRLGKITIAALNGVAAGGGAGLALSCDFRIASENARFTTAFINRGLAADTAVSYFLPRLVGLTKALDISLSGDILDAEEMERLGLVSKVVPAGKLMEATMEFAARFAKGPPVALQLSKQLMYKSLSLSLEDTLDYESYYQSICTRTEDAREGSRAFLEKREPVFTGKFIQRA